MTFPTENRPSGDDQAKWNLVRGVAFTDPGYFFGLMSVSAAHRAIVTGRHSDSLPLSECGGRVLYDSDYYLMKARCINEMNVKLRDPVLAISNEAFGTIVFLISSAVRAPPSPVYDLHSLALLLRRVHDPDWPTDDSWSLRRGEDAC